MLFGSIFIFSKTNGLRCCKTNNKIHVLTDFNFPNIQKHFFVSEVFEIKVCVSVLDTY